MPRLERIPCHGGSREIPRLRGFVGCPATENEVSADGPRSWRPHLQRRPTGGPDERTHRLTPQTARDLHTHDPTHGSLDSWPFST